MHRAAVLLSFCEAFSWVAIHQKVPKFLTAAECLPLTVAYAFDKAGNFLPAFHAAPVNSDDVAIQGLALSATGTVIFKIPARRLRIAYGFS